MSVHAPERWGVIGPNGVGKSTLLQIIAGVLLPDSGSIGVDPPRATVGYLHQEHEVDDRETVREMLRRRTGVSAAETELRSAAAELHVGTVAAGDRYDLALTRFESLGASDLDARIESLRRTWSLGDPLLDAATASLSGGQLAKVHLAAIELSRFDVTLLDEPTNDLDFEGLDLLEKWVQSQHGAVVIVSHDREFLERTVTHVAELDPHEHTMTTYAGGWSGYLREREIAHQLAIEAFERFERRRDTLTSRAQRERQWAIEGVRREKKNPRDHDIAQRNFRINRTENLAHRARQTEKALESLTTVEKPFEGWQLHFEIEEASRSGDTVVRLDTAIIERTNFILGPLSLEISFGDRVGLIGRNGAGKSTLIAAILGELPLQSGSRWMGPSVVVGRLDQNRQPRSTSSTLVDDVQRRTGLLHGETRTLLAKFGLNAQHVVRNVASLSPGERTRAELAVFQARGVNFLVLDEPTNHLDLPAIEQLESALAGFGGTILLVTHDRRLLDSVVLTRLLRLEDGWLGDDVVPHSK